MKRILYLLLFTIIFSYLSCLELTFNEKEWLEQRSVFKILVSSDNPPYEYVDENNKVTGINITLYEMLFKKLGKKVIFTTNKDSFIDIDMSSSLVAEHPLMDIASPVLYTIKLYSVSPYSNKPFSSYQHYYILKQNFINTELDSLSNKRIHLYNDLQLAYSDFKKSAGSVLIIDNFRLWEINQLNKNTENIYFVQKLPGNHDIFLWLKTDDKILFNLVSKSFSELSSLNQIDPVLEKWESIYRQNYEIRYYRNKFYVLFGITLLLTGVAVFLIFKFNLLKTNLFHSVIKTNQKNRELAIENQHLKAQLDQIENENMNVLDSINNLAITLDLKGVIKYINIHVQKVLGYSQAALIGTNVSEIISQEEKQKILGLTNSQYDKSNNEIEIKSKEGLKKHFIFTTHFSKSSGGNPQINCILQDITERKALENRLEAYTNHLEDLVKQRTQIIRESEERFRFIVEKAYDGIFLMQNNRFQLVNQTFCDLLMYSKDDLLNHKVTFLDLIKDEDRLSFSETFDQFRKNLSESNILTQTLVKGNKQPIEVEIHFTSINYNDQIVELGIVHDVMEKRIRERELLEHEKLNIVSTFAITANDRINSPLNAISGYVELLDLEIDQKSKLQSKAFENIYESIDIIRNILNKLRSMTNITLKSYSINDLNILKLEDDLSYHEEGGEHDGKNQS